MNRTQATQGAAGVKPTRSDIAGRLIVTGLGTGYLPLAPGTWGSAAVAALCLGVLYASGGRAAWTNGTMAAVAVAATAGCVLLGRFAQRAFGQSDPKQCSLDEWAGQALALCLLPFGTTWHEWLITVGAALVAFRVFDILKPPPCRRAEKFPHGWGIVADDLMAGVYANILCQILLRFVL